MKLSSGTLTAMASATPTRRSGRRDRLSHLPRVLGDAALSDSTSLGACPLWYSPLQVNEELRMNDEHYEYRFQVVEVFNEGQHIAPDLNAIKQHWKNRGWCFDGEVRQPTDDPKKDEILYLFRRTR